MNPKFYNKDGSLTRYAFKCGYIQEKGSKDGIYVSMWHEHSTFHVRKHNFRTGERIFWESFGSNELTKARNVFKNSTVKG